MVLMTVAASRPARAFSCRINEKALDRRQGGYGILGMTNGIRNALLFGAGALVAAVAVAYGLGAFAPTPAGKVADTTAPAGNSITAKEGRVPVAPGTLVPVVPAPDKPASGQA